LDATLCGDGHVVVFHDDTVDRTTNGIGNVKDLPLAALKELDAGCSFDVSFCDERIPTLEEVFEAVGDIIIINIEIKNYASPSDNLPESVAKLVSNHNLADRVLFSSFNPIALYKINKLLPEVPIGLLLLPGVAGTFVRLIIGGWIPHQALHPSLKDVSRQLIHRQQRRGRRVHVYTVNHPEDIVTLYRWGVDGIFTDDPLLARRTIESTQSAEAPST